MNETAILWILGILIVLGLLLWVLYLAAGFVLAFTAFVMDLPVWLAVLMFILFPPTLIVYLAGLAFIWLDVPDMLTGDNFILRSLRKILGLQTRPASPPTTDARLPHRDGIIEKFFLLLENVRKEKFSKNAAKRDITTFKL